MAVPYFLAATSQEVSHSVDKQKPCYKEVTWPARVCFVWFTLAFIKAETLLGTSSFGSFKAFVVLCEIWAGGGDLRVKMGHSGNLQAQEIQTQSPNSPGDLQGAGEMWEQSSGLAVERPPSASGSHTLWDNLEVT